MQPSVVKPARWAWNSEHLEPRFREIARGLRFLIDPRDPAPRNLVTSAAPVTSTVEDRLTQYGPAIMSAASGSGNKSIQYDLPPELAGVAHTVAVLQQPRSTSGDEYGISLSDTGTFNNYVGIRTNSYDFEYIVRGTSERKLTSGIGAQNEWHLAVGVNRSATDRELYVDGVSVATNTDAASPASLDTLGVLELRRSSGAIQSDASVVAFAAAWDRALTDAEIAAISADPFGLLRPVVPYPVFGTAVAPASAAVSGTIVAGGVLESEIIAGGETLIVTLTNDTWVATVGADNAITQAVIDGLDSDGTAPAGWDAVVKAGLTYTAVTRTSDTVLTITLPAFASYVIPSDETVTVTVPASAVTLGAEITAAPTFDITSEASTVAASGTLVAGGALESEIVTGGQTLVLTAANDTWVATVGADNAITTALIAGLDSDGAAPAGWDAVVKAGLTYADVTRTSDTVVTITLPAFASYVIPTSETITATVPATALTAAGQVVASPTFAVTSEASTVALSGTVGNLFESDVVDGGKTIILTASNDTWVATVGADNAITTALIAGIDSAQAEAAGWDAVVKANMTFNDVTRTSDTVVTIILAAEATYSVTANETVTATVPATALTAAGQVVAAPTFTVTEGDRPDPAISPNSHACPGALLRSGG